MKWFIAIGIVAILLIAAMLLGLSFSRAGAQPLPRPGDFYGTTLAWVEVRIPNVVTLLWTNPPDMDLAEIRMFAQETTQMDSIALPSYYGRKQFGVEGEPYVLRPGVRDSLWVSLPCRTATVGWRFWLFAVDTAGNVSQRSNIATWSQVP